MAAELTVDTMLQKAQAYLKRNYGEDTVRMDILDNNVVDGNGKLRVECTVSVGGRHSDWQKVFTFSNGEVTDMSWRHLG